MTPIRTHYDNLKVSRRAPPEVIRAAYKALALRWHPDRHPEPSEKARAERAMAILNGAYAVLADPARRAEHDRWILEQDLAALRAAAQAPAPTAASEPSTPDALGTEAARLAPSAKPAGRFWESYASDTAAPAKQRTGAPPASPVLRRAGGGVSGAALLQAVLPELMDGVLILLIAAAIWHALS